MGGAYVAKPDAVVTPDVPDDWDIDWEFPGPFPPGYEPEYALSLSAQVAMAPGIAVTDIELSLTDHEEYATATPADEATFTASFSDTGESVGIRLTGEGEFGESVDVSYTDIGDGIYGSAPDFDFDVGVSDVGRTIVLEANDTPFDGFDALDAEAEILVITAEELCDQDCEFPEAFGCVDDCSNAVEDSPVVTYVGSWDITDCVKFAEQATGVSEDDRTAIKAAGNLADDLMDEWSDLWSDYCDSVYNIETLECELEELECAGEDTAAKEAEIAAAESDRDDNLAAANAKSVEADAQADACIALVEALDLDIQVYYHDYAGTAAIADILCVELGPTCSGRDPLRCRVSWVVQSKNHIRNRCTGGDDTGNWITEIGGRYTVTGKPYIYTIRSYGLLGVPAYACVSTACVETTYYCDGNWLWHICGKTWYQREVQLKQYYPETTYTGETCC